VGDSESRSHFSNLLSWAGVQQYVTSSDYRLVARIHKGDGYHVLWVVNPLHEHINAELTLGQEWASYSKSKEIINNGKVGLDGRKLNLSIPARDVMIVRFS
jgi:hypothetical protein